VFTESALLPGDVGRVMERTENRRVPVHGYDQYRKYGGRRHEHGQRFADGLRVGHEQRTEDRRRHQVRSDQTADESAKIEHEKKKSVKKLNDDGYEDGFV